MDVNALAISGTFLLVLVLILGPYWVFVARREATAQASLRQRIRTGGSAARPGASALLTKGALRLSSIGPLNAVLSGSQAMSHGLTRLISQSGLRTTPGQVVLGSACLILLGFLVGVWGTDRSLVGAAAGFALGWIPYAGLRFLRTRRLRKFEEQFPEAVDLIARTLRAGHAFPTGLRLASEELPAPLSVEFGLLHDQQNYGLPIPDALKAFADRIPIIDARFFVTAVLTQRESGGNLAEVLDNLSAVIRERFKIKRQIRVITAHGRLTGLFLSLLPVIIAALLAIRVPDHIKLLVTDPLGVRMLTGAVILQFLGFLLIRKITNVEY
jgi:tight adherence protein B